MMNSRFFTPLRWYDYPVIAVLFVLVASAMGIHATLKYSLLALLWCVEKLGAGGLYVFDKLVGVR